MQAHCSSFHVTPNSASNAGTTKPSGTSQSRAPKPGDPPVLPLPGVHKFFKGGRPTRALPPRATQQLNALPFVPCVSEQSDEGAKPRRNKTAKRFKCGVTVNEDAAVAMILDLATPSSLSSNIVDSRQPQIDIAMDSHPPRTNEDRPTGTPRRDAPKGKQKRCRGSHKKNQECI